MNRPAEFGVWGAMTGRLAGPAVDERAVTAAAVTRGFDPADLEAAVAAAAAVRAGGGSTDQAGAAAEVIAETLAAVRSLGAADAGQRLVDWSTFGMVITVLAGSPGAGASVVAAALADVLQLAGRCVLLVDAADPARSGLAAAASVDGPWTTTVSQLLQIRYSWRQDALVARLESRLPVISPGMVPPPRFWRPALDPLHATVVDIGYDGWRATANPLLGAGAWLRSGVPTARPVLVVRPTRPSLRHAEQVLARLDPWIRSGAVTPPCQLVVVGTRRWPRGVVGAAGRRLEALLASALFLPWDGELAAGGITDQLVRVRVRTAVGRMLAEWGALPAPRRSRGRIAQARQGVA
ncbi:MAG TPA: hypothetical protein VNA11_14265 [Pseudonocardia sp.]|nr:hypothetical protein [Pseudonocardia sp.]